MKKPVAGWLRWIKDMLHDIRTLKYLLVGVAVVIVLPLLIWIAAIAIQENFSYFSDDTANAGATIVTRTGNGFADNVSGPDAQIKTLPQGWTNKDRLWFYSTTQGSDLLPYDFFLTLKKPGSDELFRSDQNMDFYRYLPQVTSKSNPDGLPVGFVKDSFKGKDYMGFTCAACHTGQINYKNTAMRIEGGPSAADMDSFLTALATALNDTARFNPQGECATTACTSFVQDVLARPHSNYASAADVITDLKRYSQATALYEQINHSNTAYGYARLDAFGRIFNRALDYVIGTGQIADIKELVDQKLPGDIVIKNALDNFSDDGSQRSVLDQVLPQLPPEEQIKLEGLVFNSPDAPVSYPFLWDIPQHDYVQWNGIAANAGLGPVGRNTGEVVGVFGTLDWKQKEGFSLSSLIEGQGFKTHVSFESSVNVHNLRLIEQRLTTLQSPQWPADVMPWSSTHESQAKQGKVIFGQYCEGCHENITRDDPNRRVVAHMSRLTDVGTDGAMANNSIDYEGQSGMLRNLYSSTDVGDILLDKKVPVAPILTKATLGTVADPYPYRNPYRRAANWLYNLIYAAATNDIKPSIKDGDYDPDTTANPFASVRAYKGRSLDGIWATAPYLHNGSVPTLYELLLPKKLPGDPADGKYRPDHFLVGSREYDPVNVGFKTDGYTQGFQFDTSLPGNSNAGHEYGTIHDTHLKPLTDDERWDLVEYLKTL